MGTTTVHGANYNARLSEHRSPSVDITSLPHQTVLPPQTTPERCIRGQERLAWELPLTVLELS
jgi:hypothetical protein